METLESFYPILPLQPLLRPSSSKRLQRSIAITPPSAVWNSRPVVRHSQYISCSLPPPCRPPAPCVVRDAYPSAVGRSPRAHTSHSMTHVHESWRRTRTAGSAVRVARLSSSASSWTPGPGRPGQTCVPVPYVELTFRAVSSGVSSGRRMSLTRSVQLPEVMQNL